MSQFFDQASLVMVPSGYKNGKVYSQKPLSADGQLAFTRSNDTATRVGPDGLIEKVRTNLLTYSNTFSDASWNKAYQGVGSVAVVTPNYTTDPFGGNNAWRFQCNLNGGTTAGDRSWMLQPFTPIADTILSIYIKLNAAGSKTIIFSNGGGDVKTITSTDWVRINIVTGGSSGEFRIGLIGGSSSDTLDCSISFAQAETGDIATDYIATTTAAVSVGPVANLPRLDYSGSSCPKLLLEPQRVNLALWSESFDNAGWTKLNATISANAATSPDGYTNADNLIPSNGASLSSISNYALQTITKAASAIQYTYSTFVKESGLNRILIIVQGASVANNASATFSLVDGSVAIAAASAGTFTGASASVTDYGNGWYRCALVFTTNTDTALTIRNIPTDSTLTTGNGTNGILIYGAQIEAGAYATSYIPTIAATTRGEDSAYKTGISSLIGQTEGVLFADVNITKLVDNEAIGTINSGGYANNTTFQRIGNTIQFVRNSATQSGASAVNSSAITTGRHKMAIAYKSGDTAFFLDGVQVSTTQTQTFTNGTLSVLAITGDAIGAIPFSDSYNQALLFTTRLTNAQLAELTTI